MSCDVSAYVASSSMTKVCLYHFSYVLLSRAATRDVPHDLYLDTMGFLCDCYSVGV